MHAADYGGRGAIDRKMKSGDSCVEQSSLRRDIGGEIPSVLIAARGVSSSAARR